MAKDNIWKELSKELRTFLKWTVSGLIDSAFLVLWVLVQWGNQKIIENLQLSGLDKWQLTAFQILFAISTLASVIIYIVTDISIMFIQAKRMVKKELEKGKVNVAD